MTAPEIGLTRNDQPKSVGTGGEAGDTAFENLLQLEAAPTWPATFVALAGRSRFDWPSPRRFRLLCAFV